MIQKLKIIFYYFYFRHFQDTSSRKKLEKIQLNQLNKLLGYVGRESTFYKKIFKNKKKDLNSCPIVDKALMVQNFDQINTLGIKKEDVFSKVIEGEKKRDFTPMIGPNIIGLSSGTSGHRGLYCVAPSEQAKHAGFLLAKQLPTLFQRNRVAYFQRNDSNLYSKGKSQILQFKFFDLVYELDKHINTLNQFNPTVLVAPGSILKRLSIYQKEGRLKISPQRIIASVEVLDPLDEKIIKENFQHEIIHQVYICTEGFLGTTCNHGTIHLNKELVYFEKEYLDQKKSKFTPILTDLNRRGQPHIRYRLNDILVLSSRPCPCGDARLAIDEIMGRSDDTFFLEHLNQAKELVEVFPDFIRRPLVYAEGDIVDYTVHQLSTNELRINLNLGDKESTLKVEESINNSFQEMFSLMHLKMPSIEYTYDKNELKLNKMRRVRRLFDI